MNLGKGALKDFLGQPSEVRKDLDSMHLIVEDIPTVIIHGKEDTRLPVIFSRNYVDYARKFIEVKYVELDNIGHLEVINPINSVTFALLIY